SSPRSTKACPTAPASRSASTASSPSRWACSPSLRPSPWRTSSRCAPEVARTPASAVLALRFPADCVPHSPSTERVRQGTQPPWTASRRSVEGGCGAQSALAMPSPRTDDETLLHARNVLAGARINLDDLALLDEQRHAHHRPRLELRRLHAALRCVPPHPRI